MFDAMTEAIWAEEDAKRAEQDCSRGWRGVQRESLRMD